MSDDIRELEMRVAGISGDEAVGSIQAALRELDPGASVRMDHATGILHIMTRYDTLEVVAALTEAGFEPQAETM